MLFLARVPLRGVELSMLPKLAAACSFNTQPNDLIKSHPTARIKIGKILHDLLKDGSQFTDDRILTMVRYLTVAKDESTMKPTFNDNSDVLRERLHLCLNI